MTSTDRDMPPHLHGADEAIDEEAEAVVSALARVWGAQPWRVTDDRSAEWLMAKARAATATITEAQIEAQEYHQRINKWLADTTREASRTLDWAEAHLCRYLADKHAADPKVKSISLPSGRVTSREGALEWRVTDPSLFVPFVRAVGMPELVKEEPAGPAAIAKALVAVEAIGGAMTPDGEAVPGVSVTRRPRTFKAQPDA